MCCKHFSSSSLLTSKPYCHLPPPLPPHTPSPLLSRVFVEFEQKKQRGRQAVLDSVLIALKKRQMREPLALYIAENIPETLKFR